jgi:hypothetical protein
VPETIDPGQNSVSTLARLFARAALRDGLTPLDETTLDQIVTRAIGLFVAGDIHGARAVFYLATPNPVIAARALDALGDPPRRPVSPPTDGLDPQPGSGEAAADLVAPTGLGDSGWRLLTAPDQAQVLLWEDAQTDSHGRVIGVYAPVPVVWPPGWCGHIETICPQCLLTWAEDHALALFTHGRQGAAVGCQCRTCHPSDAGPAQPANTPDPAPHSYAGGASGAAPTAATADTQRGGWYGREVTAAGHAVGLSIDTVTGLTAVRYPDRPPRRLGTGPHLAILAAVADALDLVLAWTEPPPNEPALVPVRRKRVWG